MVGPTPSRHADRLPAALLAYAIALAAFLLVPPYLKASVGPPQAFTLQEAVDLLTPVVVIPLAWLVFDLAGGFGRRGIVAFLVIAAVWVEGHGIHLVGECRRRRVLPRRGRGVLPDGAGRAEPLARRDAGPLGVARGVGRALDPGACRGDARAGDRRAPHPRDRRRGRPRPRRNVLLRLRGGRDDAARNPGVDPDPRMERASRATRARSATPSSPSSSPRRS